MIWLGVFLLGGLGAVCRVAIAAALPTRFLPWGTLAVNLLGCFAIGVAFYLFESRSGLLAADLRLPLVGGFLGGFTTFSAFGLECWALVPAGDLAVAGLYAGLSLILGFAGVAAGVLAARTLV